MMLVPLFLDGGGYIEAFGIFFTQIHTVTPFMFR